MGLRTSKADLIHSIRENPVAIIMELPLLRFPPSASNTVMIQSMFDHLGLFREMIIPIRRSRCR